MKITETEIIHKYLRGLTFNNKSSLKLKDDIFYEKKITMMTSSNFNLNNFTSSRRLAEPYKRTISRLAELTSPDFNKN